jgi:tRNA pseudouridine55 synthase
MDSVLDGVLVIDKPSGPTSHDVVAHVRRALHTRRIGHTGTLDPLATGVLPLVIGRATRLASFLSAGEKTYEAAVRLGSATETYDAAERLAAGLPAPPAPEVSLGSVEKVLDEFRGTYLQAPPPYSAKKIGGVAAHRLARRNQSPQPAPVSVTVSRLELVDFRDGLIHLIVKATAGFYVRSLAHELGGRLGCGAHLEALRRTHAGDFSIGDALRLGDVQAQPAVAAHRIIPIPDLLPGFPSVTVNPTGARWVSHGRELNDEHLVERQSGGVAVSAAGHVRVLDQTGRLLAVARQGSDGLLRPAVVLV